MWLRERVNECDECENVSGDRREKINNVLTRFSLREAYNSIQNCLFYLIFFVVRSYVVFVVIVRVLF